MAVTLTIIAALFNKEILWRGREESIRHTFGSACPVAAGLLSFGDALSIGAYTLMAGPGADAGICTSTHAAAQDLHALL